MRILLWHGWLLEGSGANVYTARVAEEYRRGGHQVVLLCQEPNPARHAFVDGWGTAGPDGPGPVRPTGARPAAGTLTLLRPDIGSLLPVFVLDDYPGFEVKRFVDLSDEELGAYVERNVEALRAAADAHRPDIVVTGHVVPGGIVARRALGERAYVVKAHGSDVEYAVRAQPRYRDLAREGVEGAVALTGSTRDVLRRLEALVPGTRVRTVDVPPGVEVERFRPMPRRPALEELARLLESDPELARGRPPSLDAEVRGALARRDPDALTDLAGRYDQAVPDRRAPAAVRELASYQGPLVGYLGKFIPQKGVDLLLGAVAMAGSRPSGLVVGFGGHREWLEALLSALDSADAEALSWVLGASGFTLSPEGVEAAPGLAGRVRLTGRLDHRYAPLALAATDVLVVPSVLDEAFGMVAAEGAAAGTLPLVARHSGLAEVAEALEGAVGRPGLLSFDPGPSGARSLTAALDRLLSLPRQERLDLAAACRAYVSATWTWERTAARLLEAAGL